MDTVDAAALLKMVDRIKRSTVEFRSGDPPRPSVDLTNAEKQLLVDALLRQAASRDNHEVSDERALALAHSISAGKVSAVQGACDIMEYATVAIEQEQRFAASQDSAGGGRSVALADQIHGACPHKINEPPNCALVTGRLECVCEHVHMHAIRASRLGDPVLSALVDLHSVARVDRDEDYAAVTNAAAVIEAASSICAAQASRVPKVRTSHHRNKEEATRLQALVAKRYLIEQCAKIADDFAAYEQTVLDRAYADEALSETGRKSITSSAGSRQVAAEQIAHDIRALSVPSAEGKCTCGYLHGHADDCPALPSTPSNTPAD